jgi:hypothetical protein
MYLALYVESEIIGCRLDDHVIAPLPRLKTYPKVDLRVSVSLAYLESVYPTMGERLPP